MVGQTNPTCLAVLDLLIPLVVVGAAVFISNKVKKKNEADNQRALRTAQTRPKKTRGTPRRRSVTPVIPIHALQPDSSTIAPPSVVPQPTDIEITDHPKDVDASPVEAPPVPQSTDIAIRDHLMDLHGFEVVHDSKYAPLDGLAPGSAKAQARQRKATERLNLPLEIKTKITGIRLRLIPPGEFMMGSPVEEQKREADEQLHSVTITQPFYIGAYQITQEQWRKVMGSNPSFFKEAGTNAPVERVSWYDCQLFLRKLEELEGFLKNSLRLPTEAEWEYACRAGTQKAFCYGNRLDSTMANFDGDYPYGGAAKGVNRVTIMPVGSFKPNAWGLYDMHGNVWEWCNDWYGAYSGDATDPRGPASGTARVIRGGSWYYYARGCRTAYRYYYYPDGVWSASGLRVYLPAGQ